MKIELINEIIKKKREKKEFAIVTNIKNAESFIFEKNKKIPKNFENYKKEINLCFDKKNNTIINESDIFVETYVRPIKIIIVGAVHIAQYLINFLKYLNFEIIIIDPRGYFASKERFPNIEVVNKWPDQAFSEIKTDENSALVALTHDPKIDDPAIKFAMNNNFFYIGALGSKKTHLNRCLRLKENNFSDKKISKIFGPIGIKLGGKSAPEIALSITAQLISEIYNKK